MKLYESLKKVVELKGKNVITDSALLNYLNDYHAFEEKPSAELVLRDVVNGEYSDKFLRLNNADSSWTVRLKSYEHDFDLHVCSLNWPKDKSDDYYIIPFFSF